MSRYLVVYEKAPQNWAAYVPDLPGCISTGKTREECEQNIAEAIRGHLDVMRERGEAIPPPSSESGFLDVAA
jgi:predicted RNase H-like HicB family nuclease